MKKLILKVFAIFSLAIIGCTAVFAVGRPMTSAEQGQFVAELQAWIEDYGNKRFEPLRSKMSPRELEAEVKKDIDGWTEQADTFKKMMKIGACKPWEDMHNLDIVDFGTALKLYYDYVSKGFSLDCKGLSSFVFKKLRDKGVKCCYAKIHYNPFSKNRSFITRELELNHMSQTQENIDEVTSELSKRTNLHDVVIYYTEDGAYVCDFGSAAILSLKYRFGTDETKKDMISINSGSTDMSYLMKIPLDEYKRSYVPDGGYSPLSVSPDKTYFALSDNPFEVLDVDSNPGLLSSRACEVYNHFRPIDRMEFLSHLLRRLK